MRNTLASALLGTTAAIFAPCHAQAFTFHADHVLGTSLDVTIAAVAAPLAQAAMDAIHSEIARLEMVLSGWRDDSELSALNRAWAFAASPDLFGLIRAGEAWRDRSGGAFSIRLGGLASSSQPAALAARIAAADIGLDEATAQIRRPAEVRFAVDAIAKGYIIDRALDAARAVPGVQGAMIDIGGDIACWGQAPGGTAWHIGIADPCRMADNAAPAQIIALHNSAVASSGTGARGHLIYDPATGLARGGVALTTAVASTAADADALASAVYVLPPEEGIRLADNIPGTAVRLVAADGSVQVSKAWNGLVLAQNVPARSAAPAAKAAPWPAGFEVRIDYAIPAMNGGRRARPPYVVIWITNDAGDPVRAIAFYADKPRYMGELYAFWNRLGGADLSQVNAATRSRVNAITRPTRPPGAYSVTWDGKDDAGRPLPQGRYTVNIEAAREHGGHSVQRVEMELGSTPAEGEAPSQQELGPAKVSYGQ